MRAVRMILRYTCVCLMLFGLPCAVAISMAACSPDCKDVNETSWTNKDGIVERYWKYVPDTTVSCWICGTGAPVKGICEGGNPTDVCAKGVTVIQYKRYANGAPCFLANPSLIYREASSVVFETAGPFDEDRYYCKDGP